jgi:hypothetical protein
VTIAPQAEREIEAVPARSRSAPFVVAADPWPLPARWVDLVAFESASLTRLYWAGVALVTASLFVTRLLPCVDYPQHLALSDVARRLLDPAAPEQALYQLNYFTYNGLFHVVVAHLSTVMPIELAGRLVVATSLVAIAGSVVALVRVLQRPPEYAALFTPILFSFSLGWGFVNYVLATAIASWALVAIAFAIIRPSSGAFLSIASLGLLCAFAHVLAMLILCAASAALAYELSWRVTSRSTRFSSHAAWRALRAVVRGSLVLLPLLIGCAYCIAVYNQQYDWDPNMYRDPTMEGISPSLWEKVYYFSAFATDLFGDGTDQFVLWVSVVVMGWSAQRAWRRWQRRWMQKRRAQGPGFEPSPSVAPEASPPIVAPFVVLTVAYFATPMVLVGTHLIFPRLAQWTILGAVLATPRFPQSIANRARRWIPRLGIVAGVNTVLHCALFAWETNDASATIDDMPAGGAATAVIWEPWTAAFRNGTLTHLAAYYGARKHGRWAFAFARYLSVPVRFRPGSQPAWPRVGWEFDGESYDPRCKYARAFPLVIVKAPEDLPTDASGEPLVRKLVFKQDAAAVKLLSHHGHFWAFDSSGLPDDGVF